VKIVIDTNRYRDLCVGVPEAVERIRRADAILLPFVTLAELRAGFLCGTLARRNESTLIRFLNLKKA
jgi:predicted nucleic acid-binding protein